MNLREIQLVGFKSFADKTSIPFQEGVTCIVGPNGCGKSNVADAVRWVLGEKSAKTLRGSNMQDVIFNGTEKRRALSFCEVTLSFDNSSRMFAMDSDDVSMTRRLYRNGDSEYLLNGAKCRLKDIVSLLHGVGIGKEGYSIIGQGKVTQIMNSKPEDRRAIFEEATGIMAQKQRKIEIERRLEESQDSLTVFRQRMAEAERQLGPLQEQAEVAQKYNELTAELRFHEVNAFIYRHDHAETEKGRFTQEMARLDGQIESFTAQIADNLKEREANRAKMSETDKKIAELNDELLRFTEGNAEKTGNERVYREKANAFREKLQGGREDIEACQQRIKEIDAETEATKRSIEEKTARLEEIRGESEILSLKLLDLDGQIAVYDQASRQNRLRELTSLEDLSQLKENMGSLTARKEAIASRIQEVTESIAKEEERLAGLQKQLEECRSRMKRLNEMVTSGDKLLSGQNEAIRKAQAKCDRLNEDIYSCNARIESVNNSLEMYIGQKNRFEGYKDSVRRLLAAAKNNMEVNRRIRGMIADIVSCDKKYELAIETLFGGAMQNIVTDTSEDAKYLIAFLKRNALGVVTFLPVDSMRPHRNGAEAERALSEPGVLGLADQIVRYDRYYAPVISNLLGNTVVCDNNDTAVRIAKKYAHAFRIVTLEGDIVATSGAMTGGSRKNAGNLLQNERMIKQCEDEIAAKKREMSGLRDALQRASADRKAEEEKLENLRQSLQSSASDLAAVKQQEESLSQRCEEVEGDIALYRGAVEKLQQSEESLASEQEASSATEKTLTQIRNAADKDSDKQMAESTALREERAKLNEQYNAMEKEEASLQTALENDRQTLERLKSELSDMFATIETRQNEVAEYEKEIARWDREAETQALSKEDREKLAKLRAEIGYMADEKEDINIRQADLEEEQNAIQGKINEASTKRGRCEADIARIETNLENLRQRIEEAYGMTYEDCLPLLDSAYDISKFETSRAAAKRKIAALGQVNAHAPEDYKALSARYEDMKVQSDDVQKAITDATAMLDELKKDMQKRFDEGFSRINENFKLTFKELFGGGKAELQLDYTDCEDPLDAGVEINACPPGKKLTKLSLLSGGEQALTAIAILFAIIRSNPMPFCILDEIEAALDDANVDRFARYLKKFASETQFIVITHRKPTMSQADSLFGVTMEEKGVSKIVSVKLSEVETKLGGDTVQ